jgi:GNAT superfamily N-acetyltransferase
VLVWRATYRTLAPSAAYEALDVDRRTAHWSDLLERDEAHSATFVADHEGQLVGFAHAGPGSHEAMEGSGEVVHLYVDPAVQGFGIGPQLLNEARAFLSIAGPATVRLAVVRGNDDALRFYEREGGRVVGTFVDGVLWRSENVIVEFTNRSDLATL